jgi:hypothetical protein
MTGQHPKPIVCIDFDGVIHSYERGWEDGFIYGELVPGFLEWVEQAQPHFRLVIYSSRSGTPEGRSAMIKWLREKATAAGFGHAFATYSAYEKPVVVLQRNKDAQPVSLEFAAAKPPAFLTIDDRSIQFNGDWIALRIDELAQFKPWMLREQTR